VKRRVEDFREQLSKQVQRPHYFSLSAALASSGTTPARDLSSRPELLYNIFLLISCLFMFLKTLQARPGSIIHLPIPSLFSHSKAKVASNFS
jgi:hypothetical protein